jgi:hypothetical protein
MSTPITVTSSKVVPQLNGNYDEWSPMMQAYLAKNGIQEMHYCMEIPNYEVVQKEVQGEKTNEALEIFRSAGSSSSSGSSVQKKKNLFSAEEHKKVQPLLDGSQRAYGFLYEALTEEVRKLVQHIPRGYAFGVWKYLENKYHGDELDNVISLLMEFSELRMKEDELFEAYKARVDKLKRRLESVGEVPSVMWYLGTLFTKLTPAYELVILSLKTAQKLQKDLDVEWATKEIAKYELVTS